MKENKFKKVFESDLQSTGETTIVLDETLAFWLLPKTPQLGYAAQKIQVTPLEEWICQFWAYSNFLLLFFLVPRSGIESNCKHWVSTKPHLQEVFKPAGVSLCTV